MSKPIEHKPNQARILEYTETIGRPVVSREEAAQRRGFDPKMPPADRAKNHALLHDLMAAKTQVYNVAIQ